MEEIRCFGCGECCKTLFSGMVITREEINLIESKTGISLKVVEVRPNRFKVVMQGPCPFLRDNRCSIYEIRPCQCRLYHCGRLKPGDKKLDFLADIRKLMVENSDYRKFKTKMDEEAIAWGNAHGWNWKRMKGNKE